jgi:hypothetical protein
MRGSQKKSFPLSCPHWLMCFISSSLLRHRFVSIIRSLGTTSSSPFHIASASPGRVLLGHDGVIDLTEGGGWLREFSKSSGIGMRGSALNVKVN